MAEDDDEREAIARLYRRAAFGLAPGELDDLAALGVDTVMWGDDFPHPEGATDHTTEALRATMFDVPVAECRRMLAGNAAEIYGFDLDALTPVAARIGPPVAEVHTPLDTLPDAPGVPFRDSAPLELRLSILAG